MGLVQFFAPMWLARRHLVEVLEVVATRKIVAGEPLNEVEAAIAVDALLRVRINRPGAERSMLKALQVMCDKRLKRVEDV